MIQERDEVVLTCDLPEHKLAVGDIGTVVLVHSEGRGCEVEFMTLDGETIAVSTLRADQVRQAHADESAHARPMASPNLVSHFHAESEKQDLGLNSRPGRRP